MLHHAHSISICLGKVSKVCEEKRSRASARFQEKDISEVSEQKFVSLPFGRLQHCLQLSKSITQFPTILL